MNEFDVMQGILKLDPAARKRVLAWAKELNGDRVALAQPSISPKIPETRKKIVKEFKRSGLPDLERRVIGLMKPNRKYRPARLAKRLRKSAGYISSVLSGLARAGLVVKVSRGVYQLPKV